MAIIHGHGYSETINNLDGVTDGADKIFGYGGDDIIQGYGGNDVITGGLGADHILGGSGSDTASYKDSDVGVVVTLMEGAGYNGTAQGDTLNSIENLIGSWFDDFLIGDDDNNVLTGLDGDDTLAGFDGADTLIGGEGADTLLGGKGTDTAVYTDSDEGVAVFLSAGQGFGGDAEGDELHDIENLTGSMHDDDLWGNDHRNVLRGQDGDDTLKGFGGSDTLHGGDGNDIMDGGTGASDAMFGGLGDDTYYVDRHEDQVTELAGEGNDTLYSTAYSYVLSDADSIEILSLDTATDTGVSITGNSQHQTVFGNGNDNILNGGGANNILSGLGGNDTFVFRAGEAHGDVVYEFEGNGAGVGDVLNFVGYGPGATFTQASATEWIIASADGTISEVITFIGGPAIDPTDYVIY